MFITTKQTKLDKSQAYGWLTAGINLSPATDTRRLDLLANLMHLV